MSTQTKPQPRRETLDVEFNRRHAVRSDLTGQKVIFGGRGRTIHFTRWDADSRLEVQLEPRGDYFDAGSTSLVEWKPLSFRKRQEFVASLHSMAAAPHDATLADLRARLGKPSTVSGPKGAA